MLRDESVSSLRTYKDERRMHNTIRQIFIDIEIAGFSTEPDTVFGKIKRKWLSLYE